MNGKQLLERKGKVMGEIADAVVEGEICQMCLLPFAEPYGYPVTCTECGGTGELADLDEED